MRLRLALAFLVCAAGSALGAGWRLFGESTLRHIELRQLELVEIPLSEVPGTGSLRQLPDGRWVECDEGDSTCTYYQSGDGESITPMLHDLRGTAWIDGGWSAGVHTRLRSVNAGNGELWPRAEDDFDLLGAYVDYQRNALGLRAGRQWRNNALGYANFDGLSARYAWREWFGQAFAGYTLLRTVNESVDGDALAALEELAPNEPGRLFGGQLGWTYRMRYRATGAYERELNDERIGFYAERLALDARAMLYRFDWSARLQRDLATDTNNELAFGVQSPRWRQWSANAQWRRHHPYFATWTIWNVFTPVGFDEISGRADWIAQRWPLSLTVHAAHREYGEPDVGLSFAPLREDGWNAGLQARYVPMRAWEFSGSYRRDIGLGEAGHHGLLQVLHRRGKLSAALFGTGFDYVREYRVSGRSVFGAGLQLEWQLLPDAVLIGNLAHYAHDADVGTDFDQTRGSLGLRWQLGRDPGRRESAP